MPFYDQLEKFGESPALFCETSGLVTYSELARRVDELASKIPKRTVGFIFCQNNTPSVVAYFAALRAKAVPLLLSPKVKASLLSSLKDLYSPSWIIGEGFCPEKLSLEDKHLTPVHKDLALLLSTSGSTGSSKLVRLSYANIESNTKSICDSLELKPSDRCITSLPMHYTYGLSMIQTHLSIGGSVVLTEKSLIEPDFWRLFKMHEATNFGGVPFTYGLLKRLRFEHMELPSLQFFTQAGGKLSADLAREFAEIASEKKLRFYVMYGQTEATARMAVLSPKFAIEKAGSIGTPIVGGKFSIDSASGELHYSGPNVCLGYAETPEDLSKGDENKGLLKTGDIAEQDADGFFYIVGRAKRFLKLFGHRVNLEEVETFLQNQGFDVACSGQDDRLLLYTSQTESKALISECLKAQFGFHPRSFYIEIVSEIPRNEAGKVLYTQLQGGQASV